MTDESLIDREFWGKNSIFGRPTLSWNKDVLNNVEEDVIINSIRNISFKKCFCNQEEFVFPLIKRQPVMLTVDDAMKRTVKLMKHKNHIKSVAINSQLQVNFDIDENLRTFLEPSNSKKKDCSDGVKFYKHSDSDFVNGICTEKLLNISGDNALNILRSSVTTILAFTGFTETTVLPLQVLTEVADNYIKIMLKVLQMNVEKQKLNGEFGFCDVLDRTFHEVGVGSLKNLVFYYQNCVLSMQHEKTEEFRKDISSFESIIQKIKDKKIQMELNSAEYENENLFIPELHVTSIIGNEMLSDSFETGLQMLQTMEQQRKKSNEPVSTFTNSEIMSTELANVKNELNEIKPFKRKRKL